MQSEKSTLIQGAPPAAVQPPSPPGHDTLKPAETEGGSPLKILHLDDERNFRLLLRELLEDREVELDGVHVTGASEVPEALEQTRQEKPDVVVSDRQTPAGGVAKLMEGLREMDSPPPVIVLTSKPLTEEEQQQLGVHACIQKTSNTPNMMEKLVAAIQAATGRDKQPA